MTFTKLFSSITESTILVAPDSHRICWIAMLAMADRKGRVWASVPGLASRARISVEDARAAIDSFLAPDPDSRTQDYEGRRIEVIDGGWRLLNHSKYREIRDEEAILEAKRKYINTRRAVENVDRGRHNAEADTEAEAETSKRNNKAQAPFVLPDWIPEEHWQAWIEARTKARKAPTDYAKKHAVEKLAVLRDRGFHPGQILRQSAFNGWVGLFPLKEIKFDNDNHVPGAVPAKPDVCELCGKPATHWKAHHARCRACPLP